MIYPVLRARLHGWLDDMAALVSLVGAYLFALAGPALVVFVVAAGAQFAVARLTDYPHGSVRLLPLRLHAFVELGLGLALFAAAALLAQVTLPQRLFLCAIAGWQVTAFVLADVRTVPAPAA